MGVGVTTAQAMGAGKACVFIEPQGAKFAGLNFGHIGWGYQVAGTSTWVFGATENPNGTHPIARNSFNGAWDASGTWNDMLNAFTLQTDYPSHAVNNASNASRPSAPYTQYACESVANSNVSAANAAARDNVAAGYALPVIDGGGGNDCLDAVNRVLHAYNAQNLPSITTHPGPNAWYDALSPSDWNNPGGPLGETWKNYNSGMYLDVSGPSASNGTVVHQWTYNGMDNQWWFRYAGNYGYVFTRFGPNHCLGVSGASISAGAAVVEWACNGSADQQWIFKPTGGNADGLPLYNIVNLKSHDCLGVAGGSTLRGAPVVQWPCNGHPDQEWF
jgi:hypothetical protein